MHVEYLVEESLSLVVLLEEFLTKSAFLSCKIKHLAVVKLAAKLVCKHLCHYSAAAAKLATYAYYQIVVHNLLGLLYKLCSRYGLRSRTTQIVVSKTECYGRSRIIYAFLNLLIYFISITAATTNDTMSLIG